MLAVLWIRNEFFGSYMNFFLIFLIFNIILPSYFRLVIVLGCILRRDISFLWDLKKGIQFFFKFSTLLRNCTIFVNFCVISNSFRIRILLKVWIHNTAYLGILVDLRPMTHVGSPRMCLDPPLAGIHLCAILGVSQPCPF